LARDKMRSWAVLNGDNFRISRAYQRISDHCRDTVRVRVADYCIQTTRVSDKMRISHVIKTDQWRIAPHIRPAPHFVVSRLFVIKTSMTQTLVVIYPTSPHVTIKNSNPIGKKRNPRIRVYSVVISRPRSRDSSALEFILSRSRSWSRDLKTKVSVLVSRQHAWCLRL